MTNQAMPIQTVNLEQVSRAIIVCFMADLPVACWGGVGIGKSSIFRQVTNQLNWGFYDYRLSDKEESDIGGVPVPCYLDADGNVDTVKSPNAIRYLMTRMLPYDTDEQCVVLLDEFDRAHMGVQNVSLQLLLDRCVNGHKLSPKARIVLAGNATTDVGTTPLSRAAANRIVHLYVEAESDMALRSYQAWARKNGVSPGMIKFAEERHEIWCNGRTSEPPQELGFPSPRSFDMADKIYQICMLPDLGFPTGDILLSLIQGCVGKDAARDFLAFMKVHNECPPIAEVIANPTTAKLPSTQDVLVYWLQYLMDFVSKHADDAEAIAEYVCRAPREHVKNFFIQSASKNVAITATKAYQTWAAKGSR